MRLYESYLGILILQAKAIFPLVMLRGAFNTFELDLWTKRDLDTAKSRSNTSSAVEIFNLDADIYTIYINEQLLAALGLRDIPSAIEFGDSCNFGRALEGQGALLISAGRDKHADRVQSARTST